MDYKKFKIKSSELENNLELYSSCAEWCNDNEYKIELEDGYYVTKKIEVDKEYLKYVEYKNYLVDTDYVVSKLSELMFLKDLGEDVSTQIDKYKQIIMKRLNKREFVSNYEDSHILGE